MFDPSFIELMDKRIAFSASEIEDFAKVIEQPTVVVSVGELVDKYSILDIKRSKIDDVEKLIHINFELMQISEANRFIEKYPAYYDLLFKVNSLIWDYTDAVKTMDLDHRLFPIVSNEIFELNQQRFRIKKYFNDLFPHSLKEQKSYASTYCIVKNPERDWSKFLDICIKYDVVQTTETLVSRAPRETLVSRAPSDSQVAYPPNVIVKQELPLGGTSGSTAREPFGSLGIEPRVYDLGQKPIIYVATGLLGDFIMQLSVICENYYATGQKGIVYIIGPHFRNTLEKTYADIADVIKSQEYIEDLRIGEPEDGACDIYLSSWRHLPNYSNLNWYDLFLQEYNIHLGKHNWLQVPILCEWSNKTVIHISQYRFPREAPREYCFLGPNAVLLKLEPGDHAVYTEKVGPIEVYKPKSFTELCSIIYSCKQFIGALSMPLTIAHACGSTRQVMLSGILEPDTMNIGLARHMKNILCEK